MTRSASTSLPGNEVEDGFLQPILYLELTIIVNS